MFESNPALLRAIVEAMGGPYMATGLRATCRSASLAVPRPPQKFSCVKSFEKYAAQSGNAALCEHIVIYVADDIDFILYCRMSEWAARANQRKLCQWLVEVKKADFGHLIFRGAAKYGHVELCNYAKSVFYIGSQELTYNVCKGKKPETLRLICNRPDHDYEIKGYARGGHLDLLKKNIAEHPQHQDAADGILVNGLVSHHFDVCKYAVEELGAHCPLDKARSYLYTCPATEIPKFLALLKSNGSQ